MAVDIFLKIDNLKGEAQDKARAEWIDILSWSWGVNQSGTFHMGGGGGGGKADFGDLTVTKYVDMSSSEIMKSAATGEHFDKAEMIVRKAGGTTPLDYYKITMNKVLVTSYQTGGSSDGLDRIQESITLNFAEVEIEYHKQNEQSGKSDGNTKFKYNIAQATGA